MKQTLVSGLLALSSLAALTGCIDDNWVSGQGEGKIVAIVNLDAEPLKGASRAEGDEEPLIKVTGDDLTFTLSNTEGTYSKTWTGIKNFPTGDFVVGSYQLVAEYGATTDEGHEKPALYGASDVFKVREGKTTTISLNVTLVNSMVSIVYTDAFKNYMSDWTTKVQSKSDEYTGAVLSYAKNETRPVFVHPGDVSIKLNVTKPNGVSGDVSIKPFKADARHHYKVTVDVSGEGGSGVVGVTDSEGNPVIKVTYDDSVTDAEEIEIDLSDEVLSTAAPIVTTDNFTSGDVIDFVPALAAGSSNYGYKINIKAPGGMANVKLTTVSTSLVTNQGWPATVDLAKVSSGDRKVLESLGLKTLGVWNNPDIMGVIDLSGVLQHIEVLPEGLSNQTKFTLEVTDKNGKTSDPITLTLNAGALELRIASVAAPAIGETTMTANVYYNGNSSDEITMQYLNKAGAWSDCNVVKVVKSTEASGTYVFTLSVPDYVVETPQTFAIRAKAGTETSGEAEVTPTGVMLVCNTNDVFAKSAKFTVFSFDSSLAAAATSAGTISVSDDGGKTYKELTNTVSGNYMCVSGLKAGTTYLARIKYDGKESMPISFTTEAATQLPNAGMEDWSESGSGKNWTCYYPGTSPDASVWGTNNPMTTSQGSDIAYCRATTTKPTTDAHSGSNAAWIRSMGWGSGNTSAAWSTCKMKYGDSGLLHLGASRTARPSGYGDVEGPLTTDDLDCGLAFASRPASMSFWYKYSPRNGKDKGRAEIYVYDATGKVLASAAQDLSSAGSYTQITLNLSYAAGASKAAKIYVKFLSTYNRDYLSKSSDNYERPPAFNLSDGEYLGSQLYIDDITLNY